MDRIKIFDTTLRDGEQSPGSAMDFDSKIIIAKQLSRLNVDVIEAGFPFSSSVDFNVVKELATQMPNTTICAFSRALEGDIKSAAKALNGALNGRIQIVTPVSDLHLSKRLNISRKQGLELIRKSILMAKDLVSEVSWIGEDSSRADSAYLQDSFGMAVDCGAKIVTYADTVGYSLPEEVKESVAKIVESIKSSEAVVGIHCHNDLGLAVSNTLAAVLSGAKEVQCTINGIGERAGNTSLEEFVMTAQVRKDKLNIFTDIDARLLTVTSGIISKCTGLKVARNKPIVGENAFSHSSGIHQHGILSCPDNYEIINPEAVGVKERSIIIGRHSGSHGVKHVLNSHGYSIDSESLILLMKKIKKESIKGCLSDNNVIDLFKSIKKR